MNTIKEIRESSLQKINKAGMLIIAVTIVPVFATLIGVGFYVLLPQLTWTKLIMILGGILFTLIAWLVILYHSSRETSHTQQKLDYEPQVPLNVHAIRKAASKTGTYSAALLATASMVPMFSSLLSIIIFIMMPYLQWSKLIAILGGTVFTLIVWLLLAVPYQRLTAVDCANTSSYELLVNRLHQLGMWIAYLEAEKKPDVESIHEIRHIGLKEVRTSYEAIYRKLGEQSLSWMLAVGYVNTWRLIHRADEALINAEPVAAVIYDALHDEMSLKDSALTNRDDLLIKLRKAVKTLDNQAATYLIQQPPEEDKKHINGSKTVNIHNAHSKPEAEQPLEQNSVNQGNHTSTSTDEMKMQARTIIREVRFTIHQFRDDRWEKLVRVRNHLMRMMILTGLILYIFIEFVIITINKVEIEMPMLEAATIFFFVGAVVGLFGRLYDQSKTDTSIDDFRLAAARLIAAPLYSGIAALGGVLIVQRAVLGSNNMFELSLSTVLVAAVFGLTPSLFTNAIQKEADQYKSDLSSTGAPKGVKRNVSFP